jgi:hypothetical protein
MRVWSFGCSFTQYLWPTWADIIIHHANTLGNEGHNLGRCGAGNQFIASRVWECNAKYKFSSDDWVFICWSGFNREDRFTQQKGWVTPGNVHVQDIFGTELLQNWAYDRHYAMRDAMLITSTVKGLQQLGVNVVTWHMNPIRQLIGDYAIPATGIIDIIDTYELGSKFPSMMEFMGTVNQDQKLHDSRLRVTWDGSHVIPEFHPTPAEHLSYLQTYICDEIPWMKLLNQSTIDFAMYWEDRIKKMTPPVLLTNENTGWLTPVKLDLWN